MNTSLIFFIVAIPFLFFLLVNGRMQLKAEISLLNYLEQQYKTQWQHLTSNGSYNPRFVNGFTPRMILFLFSKEKNEDNELLGLKGNLKKRWFYGLVAIVAFPLLLCFVLIVRILLTFYHW